MRSAGSCCSPECCSCPRFYCMSIGMLVNRHSVDFVCKGTDAYKFSICFWFCESTTSSKTSPQLCLNLDKASFAIASHTICVERRSFRDCWVIYDCLTSRSLVTRFQARPHRINFLMVLPASLATIRPETHWPEYLHDSNVKIAGIQSLARLFSHRFA